MFSSRAHALARGDLPAYLVNGLREKFSRCRGTADQGGSAARKG